MFLYNKEKMNRLDFIAMSILKGLMRRYKECGYTDEHAISEAYRLAEKAINKISV